MKDIGIAYSEKCAKCQQVGLNLIRAIHVLFINEN